MIGNQLDMSALDFYFEKNLFNEINAHIYQNNNKKICLSILYWAETDLLVGLCVL